MGPPGAPGEDGQRVSASLSFLGQRVYEPQLKLKHLQVTSAAASRYCRLLTREKEGLYVTFDP